MKDLLGGSDVYTTLADDMDRWPLIVRGTKNVRKADAVKIEWLVDRLGPCPHCGALHHDREIEHNFMQIIRTPFYGATVSALSALEQHLDQIEYALRGGHRHLNLTGEVWSSMGGVFELLGRWPRKEDELCLRILHPTTLLARPAGAGEWLTELSLEARRGVGP